LSSSHKDEPLRTTVKRSSEPTNLIPSIVVTPPAPAAKKDNLNTASSSCVRSGHDNTTTIYTMSPMSVDQRTPSPQPTSRTRNQFGLRDQTFQRDYFHSNTAPQVFPNHGGFSNVGGRGGYPQPVPPPIGRAIRGQGSGYDNAGRRAVRNLEMAFSGDTAATVTSTTPTGASGTDERALSMAVGGQLQNDQPSDEFYRQPQRFTPAQIPQLDQFRQGASYHGAVGVERGPNPHFHRQSQSFNEWADMTGPQSSGDLWSSGGYGFGGAFSQAASQGLGFQGSYPVPTVPAMSACMPAGMGRIRAAFKPGRECKFCKNNGESPDSYRSHVLRNPGTGQLICPVLRDHRCEVCGATGDDAHTKSYCPEAKKEQKKSLPTMLKETKRQSDGTLRRGGKQ